MSMTKPAAARRQTGFTLVELIVFIVVVGVGLAGILSVMDTSVKSSADPMIRKQAIAIAESVLEEVLQKAYVDPDDSPAVVEASRDLWDDVDDYNGQTQAAFAFPSSLSAYTLAISVTADSATLGIAAKRVRITVTRGAEAIVLTGYRTNY
ncbi:prepilin-type N-terminal cleavage/methylation domain-containing protein [Rhodoferax sp.]|uniref:type IV pilus modification PilV family protein n=1 Tax=Rhodoferax sp. TaxID=50421 RepID=UPI0026006533|nr:prepilin-type N-terminal cleavage/methylation domain-containing protein [Rhodoferax sp.]